MSTTDKVRRLKPVDRFLYFVQERQDVALKKNSGQPKPWTDDEILQRYKFCNIRRVDDKVSQWLLHNWYYPNKDHPNMLLAATLARWINKPEVLEIIGFPYRWRPTEIMEILDDRQKRGLRNFNGAYMLTTVRAAKLGAPPRNEGETKQFQAIWRVCDPVYKASTSKATEIGLEQPLSICSSSMEITAKRLIPFPGFGTFMAGQVTADLRHAVTGKWRDKDTWAPAGPGSLRGMNRLNGKPLKNKIPEREFLDNLKGVAQLLQKRLKGCIHKLEAIDVQNCLCEFDKYERTLHGEGRPRVSYNGTGE